MQTATEATTAAMPEPRGRMVQFRYRGVWYLVAVLLLLSLLLAPASLRPTSMLGILPFVAFLAIAAMGEALVVLVGGLDVSIPAVIGLVAVALVALTGGANPNVPLAIVEVLAMAGIVGLVNGVLVSVLQLNVLLVTLSMNTILTGGMLLYLRTIHYESRVAASLERFGMLRPLGVNISVYIAVGLVLAISLVLNYTQFGRRVRAVGANPAAAWVAGIPVQRYQIGTYVAAALLYAIAGILLSAFTVTPNKDAGASYFFAPIVAVVLGTGTLAGGMSSMVATFGGAFFLTQLSQLLTTMGISGYMEYLLQGVALGGGMAATNPRLRQWFRRALEVVKPGRARSRKGC